MNEIKNSYACACAYVASEKQNTVEGCQGCFGTFWETQRTDQYKQIQYEEQDHSDKLKQQESVWVWNGAF